MEKKWLFSLRFFVTNISPWGWNQDTFIYSFILSFVKEEQDFYE